MDENEWVDPIVEEVRQIREKMLEEAGGDFNVLVERLMKEQEKHGEKLVRPPRRPRG